ncbi:heterokaryon incompatibility protein-domain-containing protein [Hypoxylon rubiginosum]|uniref:Heterokaryon incompatibility protein-domain-containing protein n=1 Tax=Hypoxylon rubiginosum TaxID=110542 RepID=A0ACC0CKA1_9PEZI|nr:heterokaryon incompatibility protein-domain-containing protein [Hypoxylon rubiginosum]
MPLGNESRDDMRHPLSKLSGRNSRGRFIEQLRNIQQARIKQDKSREFIERLECLKFQDSDVTVLDRHEINAYQQPRYVALSYTWERSRFETNVREGGYSVAQKVGSGSAKPSPVRDTVFSRIYKYMQYHGVEYLWIDQHCIVQEGEEKEIGMNAMDRVYSRSSHPVALLTRPINSSVELRRLIRILDGQLVWDDGNGFSLSRETTRKEALDALILLKKITSDMWFERGWTFQENYKGGVDMKLLIPTPHHSIMRRSKSMYMYSIDGDLCVDSVKLHEEATKLCLAYPELSTKLYDLYDHIISRVGKYTILLQYEDAKGDNVTPQSMSPTIIKDLTTRKLHNVWDRLPIVANCCQYSVRLNSSQLQAKGYSLSLSMLALCLLNGEILSNHPRNNIHISRARKLPVIKFLKKLLFNRIQSPYLDKGLTYNKGCRLVGVKLAQDGIHTKGHLWRCNRLIPTRGFWGRSYDRDSRSPGDRLERWAAWRLRQLAKKLYFCGEKRLSRRIGRFVSRNRSSSPQTFSQKWMVEMATLLAHAIDRGVTLCTAYLFGGGGYGDAIFIVEEAVKDRNYVFTSVRPKRENSEISDFDDIDKHVSLEVDLDNPEERQEDDWLPRLFTKRWIVGLCLFSRCPLQDVVFPWPRTLQGL